MSEPRDPDAARDRLVEHLVERVRARLGGIRAAVETLDAYPAMPGDTAAQFRSIIRDEAQALSGELEGAVAAYARLAAAAPRQTVRADALARRVAGAVAEAAGVSASVGETVPAEVLADPEAVAGAAAFVAERAVRAADAEVVRVGAVALGRLVALDLEWEGAPVRQERLDRWAARPVDGLGRAGMPLAEWLDAVDGTLWAEPTDVGGRLRLLLPCRPEAG
ncbi:MAG: hypothetical protein AAF845_03855 [Bacteroidota bacterium]